MPKIELYPHNQAALNHLEEALKYTRRAAVIQPTGTGKSFVALAFIERRPNNSFLYLAPSTHIFNQLKHHAGHTDVLLHTTMMTYQKLCLLHEDELGKLEPDYIILDEFHRCGADDWGSAVDHGGYRNKSYISSTTVYQQPERKGWRCYLAGRLF